MAEIVVGVGTSHGPLLNTPPTSWGERGKADRGNPALVYKGQEHTFAELDRLRGGGTFADECLPDVWQNRHASCRRAIRTLGEVVRGAELDALVVVSSDHKETFGDELLPAFAIYHGDTVEHVPFMQEHLDAMPPGLAIAEVANVPDVPVTRKCHPELALHLVKHVGRAAFDPAASRALPAGRYGDHGIPHGWGFVYQQVLDGSGEIPFVPVFVNTFWEPNPPTAARCYAFGRALGAGIAAFAGADRVGVVASGGLSHMVVDEELDRAFLDALLQDDSGYMAELPDALLRSGTSELRNWIVVAGAMSGTGLRPEVVEYQPCYRTEAGTGCAMGFVTWTRVPAAAA